MDPPNDPTAAELAEFLLRNDDDDDDDDESHGQLSFQRRWYAGMGSWSEEQIRAVSDAAQRGSPSLRTLAVDVADLSPKVAGVIAQIICQLRHVRTVWILDSVRYQRAAEDDDDDDDDAPTMARPDVVDAVLHGIMESRSRVEHLRLYGCCSSRTIRQFIERFPSLKRLDVYGRGPREADPAPGNRTGDAEFDDYIVSLALGIADLRSLREQWLDGDSGPVAFLTLLSAVESSPTLETVSLSLSNRSRGLLRNAFLFFATRCPGTVLTVNVQSNGVTEELLDISSLFPVGGGANAGGGGRAAFAPSIFDVQFARCEAPNADSLFFDRAAAALTHVRSLGLFQCRFPPWALEQLLSKLPRLRGFCCLSRVEARSSTQTLDDEFTPTPYALGTNDALTKLCQVIERPASLLDNVDLDVVSSDDTMHFPAIESLLKHSKGELIVNFGQLPPLSRVHVVRGCKGLSLQLKVLRIRFCRCEFGDGNFASFLRALGARKSLTTLEFGFDAHANLGTPMASIAAMRDLVQRTVSLQVLALRGLGPDAVVALCERILPVMTRTNRTLRELDFFGAGLADTDFWPRLRDPVLAALQGNGILAQLGGDLRVPDDDRTVRHLLTQNQYGRQFLLPRHAPAPKGLWATIFARISKGKRHEVMYAFLRSKLVSLLHPIPDSGGGVVGAKSRRGNGRKRRRAVA